MVFDSFLCWPRTKAGGKVWQKCPEGVRGLDSQSKPLIHIAQWAKILFLMSKFVSIPTFFKSILLQNYFPFLKKNRNYWNSKQVIKIGFLPTVQKIILCMHNSISESVFRHCLSDGTWFSCPGLNTSQGLGWTNYSLCWTASTHKIMADLNQTPNCPNAASDEDNSAEVRVLSPKGFPKIRCIL